MNIPNNRGQPRGHGKGDTGSASVELTLLVPVLVLALVLMVVAGRQISAALITQDAATAAARAASLQRGPDTARSQARNTAEREIADRGLVCGSSNVVVDTSRFTPGGAVEVEVVCTVTMMDLGGFGGQRALSANAVSPVDPYRGQTP